MASASAQSPWRAGRAALVCFSVGMWPGPGPWLLAQPAETDHPPPAGPAQEVPTPETLDGADPLVAAELTRAIERARTSPDDPLSWERLATLYHAHLYLREALACYERLASLRALTPRELYWMSLAQYQFGEQSEAIRSALEAMDAAPAYAPLAARAGSWLLEGGRADEAEAAFRRALEADPDSSGAWAGLARVHLLRGDGARAEAVIRERLLTREDERYARHLLAEALRRQGRGEEAARERSRADAAPPGWPDPWAEELWALQTGYRAETRRADRLIREGALDDAEELLRSLLRHYPDDLNLWNRLGGVHVRRGELDAAFELWERCVEADPTYARAHLNLGIYRAQLAARGQADPDAALASLDRGLELDPTSSTGWRARAVLMQALQRPGEAAAAYRRALEVDPGNTRIIRDLGRLEMSRGEWASARETFHRLLQLLPGDVPSRVGVARATLEMGELERASDMIDSLAGEAPAGHPIIRGLRAQLEAARAARAQGGGG